MTDSAGGGGVGGCGLNYVWLACDFGGLGGRGGEKLLNVSNITNILY